VVEAWHGLHLAKRHPAVVVWNRQRFGLIRFQHDIPILILKEPAAFLRLPDRSADHAWVWSIEEFKELMIRATTVAEIKSRVALNSGRQLNPVEQTCFRAGLHQKVQHSGAPLT
jgi:hypothetical protein